MSSTREHYTSHAHRIAADVFRPSAPGRHPACLILHGTFGLHPELKADLFSFGHALADAGIAAIVPHYFDRTGTAAGLVAGKAIEKCLPDWVSACADGLLFAAHDPRVAPGRLGAIGFSLGAHIGLTIAMAPPAGATLTCVVDFFGPTLSPTLVGARASLPPVQIHHGKNDAIVPIQESEHLVAELEAAGKAQGTGYELLPYANQGHGFTGAAFLLSRARAIAFVQAAI